MSLSVTKATLLSDIHLSKDIAELEDDIRLLWEPPDIYHNLFTDNVWLIYGRKGSGKSHLVDYMSQDDTQQTPKHNVIVIRPREDKLFPTVMGSISEVVSSDERIVTENVAAMLEFIVLVLLMRRSFDLDDYILPGEEKNAIESFLTCNELHQGSLQNLLTRIVVVLSRITGGSFKMVENLPFLLSNDVITKGYQRAKEALWRCMRQTGTLFIICIDDIDEIGFAFSKSDRLFINALIVMMVRLNLNFMKTKLPVRVLLTSPSELFFHSTLWGGDWVDSKSRCLRWTHQEGIQKIVNKRIGQQLNVRKSNRRNEYDIYSDVTDQTWSRLFPSMISNKLGRREPSFLYLLRHTFYTPRHILELSDKILQFLGEKGVTYEGRAQLSNGIWNEAFQSKVEEYTCNVVNTFLVLYTKIYDGLDVILHAFSCKSAIWTKGSLCSFVDKNHLSLTRRDSMKEYKGEELIDRLQQFGFFGLGVTDLSSPVMMTRTFQMRFAYLERLPIARPWEIAVVSPVFYDTYGIQPPDSTIIIPHERLTLSQRAWGEIAQYQP